MLVVSVLICRKATNQSHKRPVESIKTTPNDRWAVAGTKPRKFSGFLRVFLSFPGPQTRKLAGYNAKGNDEQFRIVHVRVLERATAETNCAPTLRGGVLMGAGYAPSSSIITDFV